MAYLIKAEVVEGRDLQCIDLPEKYWTRIPKCFPAEVIKDSDPTNIPSLDEEKA